MNDRQDEKLEFAGMIPELALKEFDSEESIDAVNPQEIIALFQSVVPEFGESGLTYNYDESMNGLLLTFPDLKFSTAAISLDHSEKWNWSTRSDCILMRTILDIDEAYLDLNAVMALNEAHPHIKLYRNEAGVVIEDAYNLVYGVSVLNIMERLSAYLQTVDVLALDHT